MINEEIMQLQESTTAFDVIKQLKLIGKDILKNYIIKLGSDKKYLIPVWIEAYCYKKDCFEDQACDGARRKKDNSQYFGEEEEHWGKTFTNLHFSYCPKDIDPESWRRSRVGGRVDIVPEHDRSFALSYLLKLAILIDEDTNIKELKIQSEIARLLKDYDDGCVKLTKTQASREIDVESTKRVGLNKGCYKDEKLSFYCCGKVCSNYEEIVRKRNTNEIINWVC